MRTMVFVLWLAAAALAGPAFSADKGAADKAGIVITSEPLMGNTAEVQINGKRIASVGPDDPYKGLHDPGKWLVTVKGGKVEVDAQPGKEYVFHVAAQERKGFFSGPFLSAVTAEYTITLKETRDLAVK